VDVVDSEETAPRGKGLFDTKVRLPGGLEISFPQVLLVAGIVFFALATPGDLDYKIDALGFGVCHQIGTHSYFAGEHQLPLCARCTGIYLGALSGLVLLMGLRPRARRLPARGIALLLGVFFLAMILDGVNSTLQTFGGGLWQTTNFIRIVTGALAGIAIVFIFYPVFNMSLWNPDTSRKERSVEQPFELVGYLVLAGILVALVVQAADWLYYPLAFLGLLGLVALLTMANTILVLIISRREATIRTMSAALTPILIGLLISLVELALLAWGRSALAPFMANNLGLPVVPGLP
jgi:uncharacterized membrane protein